MGDLDREAVLKGEQAAIDHAYACLERTRSTNESLLRPRWSQSDPESGTSFISEIPLELQRVYDDADDTALVVMRVDVDETEEPETFYVGRRTVKDPADDRRIVINWSSRAAIRWQLALPTRPDDIRLRRHLRCVGSRVAGYSDDIVP